MKGGGLPPGVEGGKFEEGVEVGFASDFSLDFFFGVSEML
jgi:hypothetical protein